MLVHLVIVRINHKDDTLSYRLNIEKNNPDCLGKLNKRKAPVTLYPLSLSLSDFVISLMDKVSLVSLSRFVCLSA